MYGNFKGRGKVFIPKKGRTPMKRSIAGLLVGISILMLAACSTAPTPKSVPSTLNSTSPTSNQPLPTLTPKQFPTLFPTGTPYAYSTAIPEKPASQNCLTIEDYIPGQTSLDGVLLLLSTEPYGRESAYDFKTGGNRASPLIPTPGRSLSSYYRDFAISPDEKWIAYLESTFDAAGKTSGRYLQVADVNGKKLDLPTWSFVNTQWLMGWINDEQIAIKIPGKPAGTIVALDPFSGKVDYLPPPDSPMVDFGPDFTDDVLYNSSLTQVVFVKGAEYGGDLNYALMDRSTGKTIWENEFHYIAPRWAPDGQSFAFFMSNPLVPSYFYPGDLLYQVTLDGRLFPLTITQTEFSDDWSWSPDSRFIAAMLYPKGHRTDVTDYSDLPTLHLIDIIKHSSIDYCLGSEDTHWAPGPVWSPDSQYVAIPMIVNPGEYNYYWETILVDVKNNKAYHLRDNVVPVGWMAEP